MHSNARFRRSKCQYQFSLCPRAHGDWQGMGAATALLSQVVRLRPFTKKQIFRWLVLQSIPAIRTRIHPRQATGQRLQSIPLFIAFLAKLKYLHILNRLSSRLDLLEPVNRLHDFSCRTALCEHTAKAFVPLALACRPKPPGSYNRFTRTLDVLPQHP